MNYIPITLVLALLFPFSCKQKPTKHTLDTIYSRNGKPLKQTEKNINSSQVDWQLLNSKAHSEYNAIGKFLSSCTGIAIDAIGNNKAPGYVLTAGHCSMDQIRPGEIKVNPSTPESVLKASDFADTQPIRLFTKQMVYGSIVDRDIAIFELEKTVGELKKHGIKLLPLYNKIPRVGMKVQLVGVPQTGLSVENKSRMKEEGYIKQDNLRRSECVIEEVVPLLAEGILSWKNVYRHKCSTLAGGSGSALLTSVNNKLYLVGIMSTSTHKGLAPCIEHNPCEIKNGRPENKPNYHYSQNIYNLANCFDKKGNFNLLKPECPLLKPMVFNQ